MKLSDFLINLLHVGCFMKDIGEVSTAVYTDHPSSLVNNCCPLLLQELLMKIRYEHIALRSRQL